MRNKLPAHSLDKQLKYAKYPNKNKANKLYIQVNSETTIERKTKANKEIKVKSPKTNQQKDITVTF